MDEKELIERTRNSLKAKKSRADLLRTFQKRGYKLEYAEQILSKATRPKRIALFALYAVIILLCLTTTSFALFALSTSKGYLENPFSGLKLTGNAVSDTPSVSNSSEIEITPEFISFLLNEIGAWQLHRNPLTFEKPIINFQIGNQTFHSEIGSKIQTKTGLSDNADIQFEAQRDEVITALTSKDPKTAIKDSISSGKTIIQIKASEAELFSKGYKSLYDSLK
jgi:hypothetical protein